MWCGSPLPSAVPREAFPFCLFYQWGNTAETIEGSSFITSGNPWLDLGTLLTLAGGDTREVLVALALQSGFENTAAGTVNAQPSGSQQAVSVC